MPLIAVVKTETALKVRVARFQAVLAGAGGRYGAGNHKSAINPKRTVKSISASGRPFGLSGH